MLHFRDRCRNFDDKRVGFHRLLDLGALKLETRISDYLQIRRQLKHGSRTTVCHADILQLRATHEYRCMRACRTGIIIAYSFQGGRQDHTRDGCLFECIALDCFQLRIGEVNDTGQTGDLKECLKPNRFQVGRRRKINEHLLTIKACGNQFLSSRRIAFDGSIRSAEVLTNRFRCSRNFD